MLRTLAGTVITYDDATNYGTLITRGFMTSIGVVPTTANIFSLGCRLLDLVTGVEYINIGTVAIPVWNSSDSTLRLATVALTAADIVATTAGTLSHAEGLIVVPAAATGFVNQLVSMMVSFNYLTDAFAGGGNTTVNIGGGGAAISGLIATTSLFTKGSSTIINFVPLSTVGYPITKETSINLVTASAITQPGTAAGTAKVYCWYRTVAI